MFNLLLYESETPVAVAFHDTFWQREGIICTDVSTVNKITARVIEHQLVFNVRLDMMNQEDKDTLLGAVELGLLVYVPGYKYSCNSLSDLAEMCNISDAKVKNIITEWHEFIASVRKINDALEVEKVKYAELELQNAFMDGMKIMYSIGSNGKNVPTNVWENINPEKLYYEWHKGHFNE